MPLSVALAFLLAVGLTPLLARWARRHDFLDVPNPRSSHVIATPRTGGAAFVPAFVISLLVAHSHRPLGDETVLVVGAASAQALLGLADDLKPLPAVVRLLVQTTVSSVLVAALEWQLLPAVLPAWIGTAMTVFWLVAFTNAYNFMDGIDGIAGGQAVVTGLAWAVVGAVVGSRDVITLGLLGAAAVTGFLIYNWPPARVFMGDVGSAFLGFLFAAMPLVAADRGPRALIWGGLLAWPFLFDTGFTLVQRMRRRENIFSAHRSHLYQRLTTTGLPHWRVTVLYLALGVIGAAASIGLAARQPGAGLVAVTTVTFSAFALWRYVVWREARPFRPSSGH